jgi:hypothetical protein
MYDCIGIREREGEINSTKVYVTNYETSVDFTREGPLELLCCANYHLEIEELLLKLILTIQHFGEYLNMKTNIKTPCEI